MLGAPTSFQMENAVQLSTSGPRAPPHAKARACAWRPRPAETRFPCLVPEAGSLCVFSYCRLGVTRDL